jgi:hypothetical protein
MEGFHTSMCVRGTWTNLVDEGEAFQQCKSVSTSFVSPPLMFKNIKVKIHKTVTLYAISCRCDVWSPTSNQRAEETV